MGTPFFGSAARISTSCSAPISVGAAEGCEGGVSGEPQRLIREQARYHVDRIHLAQAPTEYRALTAKPQPTRFQTPEA